MKLENITNIEKSDDGYCIFFDDEKEIKLKGKRTILPLLFLIKYGESCNLDFFNDRFEYIHSILGNKYPDIIRNDYKDIYNPYIELYSIEHFSFIKKKRKSRRVYYILDKKDHHLLCNEYNHINTYETREYDKGEILKQQKGLCKICKKKLKSDDGVLDYIIPLLRGGKDEYDNIQVICNTCYIKKRNRCKKCIEECNITNCPIYKEKEIKNSMTIPKKAIKSI